MASRKIRRKVAYQAALKLLKQAYEEEVCGDSKLSTRHAELAFKLLQSVRMRAPTSWRRRVCRRCYTILIPGRTSRVRVKPQSRRASHITVTCLRCGWKRRYYIKGGRRS